MGFFDDEANVDQYESMVEDYDGQEIIDRLKQFLPSGATLLELGMGPGKDLDLLTETFDVTGSDSSKVFLDRYRARNPEIELLRLDAETLETDRTFDGLFSNKVLQHLTKDQARRSLGNQARLLNPGGIAFHTLWYGDNVETYEGLLFVQYTEESFAELLHDDFELLSTERYTEMEENDSIVVVLKKRSSQGFNEKI